MVLPDKHLPLDRTLLSVGGEILRILSDRPRSVSSAWEELRTLNNRLSFEQFTLAASFLFLLGAVDIDGGNLQRNVA
ncbi:MAG TPA: ABC-three component system middle component 6 [Terriglobia bacterium]|nr:ABC-three component system middle component 6 [Terriglobia bacterium]